MIAMTSSTLSDSEQAWDAFVEKRSFEKATSIQGQLDTMGAMLNEIRTNTERTAEKVEQMQAEPMAPPMDMPPEEMPMEAPMEEPMEEPLPEEMGEAPVEELPPEDVIPENVGAEADLAGAPAEMPPMEPEFVGGEPMGEPEAVPEMEPMPEQPPVEEDMISQIKTMIASSDDPEQLKGLSKLLSTALAQSQPAVPMENADAVMKAADVNNDGLEVMRDELKGAVDSTLGVGFKKGDDGIAEVADSKDAVEAVTAKDTMQDAPEPATSLTKSEDAEVVAEEVEMAPVAEDPKEEFAEVIADKVAEKVAEVIDDKADDEKEEVKEDISEETESFEECNDSKKMEKSADGMPSFEEMFAKRNGVGNAMARYRAAKDETGAVKDSDAASQAVQDAMGVPDEIESEHQIMEFDRQHAPVEVVMKSIPSAEEMFAKANGVTMAGRRQEAAKDAEDVLAAENDMLGMPAPAKDEAKAYGAHTGAEVARQTPVETSPREIPHKVHDMIELDYAGKEPSHDVNFEEITRATDYGTNNVADYEFEQKLEDTNPQDQTNIDNAVSVGMAKSILSAEEMFAGKSNFEKAGFDWVTGNNLAQKRYEDASKIRTNPPERHPQTGKLGVTNDELEEIVSDKMKDGDAFADKVGDKVLYERPGNIGVFTAQDEDLSGQFANGRNSTIYDSQELAVANNIQNDEKRANAKKIFEDLDDDEIASFIETYRRPFGKAEATPNDLGVETEMQIQKSAKPGKHIASFSEMYASKRDFSKSADRPVSQSAINGSVGRPTLDPIQKSADRPVLRMGHGVDPHEVMKADWDRYYALMGAKKI